MTTNENSVSSSEQGKKQELLGGKERVWNDFYLKGNFLGGKPIYDELYRTGLEWHVDSETMAEIIADKAWNEYYIDKNGTTKTNTSYLSAKEGLEKLKDSEDLPKTHALRSRLFEVAGLCQTYLVSESDEPAEPLFRQSIEEAEKSKILERIGEAKNGFGTWLIAQKRFEEAIPLFQDVARTQEEIGNKRTAGHAYNNLAGCFNETKKYENAVSAADKALELYGDPNLNHSFSARFRKSLALRGLGKKKRDKSYFDQSLAIYEQHKIFRNEELVKVETEDLPEDQLETRKRVIKTLISNEDKNISSLRQEMQALGFS